MNPDQAKAAVVVEGTVLVCAKCRQDVFQSDNGNLRCGRCDKNFASPDSSRLGEGEREAGLASSKALEFRLAAVKAGGVESTMLNQIADIYAYYATALKRLSASPGVAGDGVPCAWRHETPYGTGYSFAEDVLGYLDRTHGPAWNRPPTPPSEADLELAAYRKAINRIDDLSEYSPISRAQISEVLAELTAALAVGGKEGEA